MVDFDIKFEIFVQPKMTQEADDCFGIVVVLVLGRLHGFGLNEKRAFKPIFSSIISSHGQELAKVFFFTLHVCVEQGHIAFSTSPEYVIFSTQLDGGIYCIFHLRSRKSYRAKVRVGGSTIHVAWIAKHVGSTPEELHTTCLLVGCSIGSDGLHAAFVGRQGWALFDQVYIVEAVIIHPYFIEKFKGSIHFVFCTLHWIGACVPRMHNSTWTKRISTGTAEGVPIGNSKFKVLLHRLSGDDTVRVVVAKGKWVVAFFSFKLDFSYLGKIRVGHSGKGYFE